VSCNLLPKAPYLFIEVVAVEMPFPVLEFFMSGIGIVPFLQEQTLIDVKVFSARGKQLLKMFTPGIGSADD
jgi:hypothetical protein